MLPEAPAVPLAAPALPLPAVPLPAPLPPPVVREERALNPCTLEQILARLAAIEAKLPAK